MRGSILLKSLLEGRDEGAISILSSPLGVQILIGLIVGLGVAVDGLLVDT